MSSGSRTPALALWQLWLQVHMCLGVHSMGGAGVACLSPFPAMHPEVCVWLLQPQSQYQGSKPWCSLFAACLPPDAAAQGPGQLWLTAGRLPAPRFVESPPGSLVAVGACALLGGWRGGWVSLPWLLLHGAP